MMTTLQWEFVISVLERIFFKSRGAKEICLPSSGVAFGGVFVHEVAETKVKVEILGEEGGVFLLKQALRKNSLNDYQRLEFTISQVP